MLANSSPSALVDFLNNPHLYQVALGLGVILNQSRRVFLCFFRFVSEVVTMYYDCRRKCRDARQRFINHANPIDSPLVSVPNVLIAMNEPSLRKFAATVLPNGWVLYNGDSFPEECARPDVHVLALPFTRIADELGDGRAANMVMLGAFLEITGGLPPASVDAALRRLVKGPHWIRLDRCALTRGGELYRESLRETTGAD